MSRRPAYPVSRKEFWDMLGRLKEQGITILVSTAYMDEASRCDRIALIREGEFIASDTPKASLTTIPKCCGRLKARACQPCLMSSEETRK